jgi:hemin uptake protein HemP
MNTRSHEPLAALEVLATAARSNTSTASAPHILNSRDLLAGQGSVFIRHLGEVYRLQTTRQGKLILTK